MRCIILLLATLLCFGCSGSSGNPLPVESDPYVWYYTPQSVEDFNIYHLGETWTVEIPATYRAIGSSVDVWVWGVGLPLENFNPYHPRIGPRLLPAPGTTDYILWRDREAGPPYVEIDSAGWMGFLYQNPGFVDHWGIVLPDERELDPALFQTVYMTYVSWNQQSCLFTFEDNSGQRFTTRDCELVEQWTTNGGNPIGLTFSTLRFQWLDYLFFYEIS